MFVKCQKKILQCLLCQVPEKDMAMSFVSSARKKHCNVFCVKCQEKTLQCLLCQVPEKDIAMSFLSSARKRYCNVFCVKCQKKTLQCILYQVPENVPEVYMWNDSSMGNVFCIKSQRMYSRHACDNTCDTPGPYITIPQYRFNKKKQHMSHTYLGNVLCHSMKQQRIGFWYITMSEWRSRDEMTPHAVCCSVLQCVAVCCSVLQCVAMRCSVLQCVAATLNEEAETTLIWSCVDMLPGVVRKKALHTRKRAWYLYKRALYLCKRILWGVTQARPSHLLSI